MSMLMSGLPTLSSISAMSVAVPKSSALLLSALLSASAVYLCLYLGCRLLCLYLLFMLLLGSSVFPSMFAICTCA